MLAALREAEIAVARLKRLEGGLLTIGIAGVAEHVVPQMLARFHKEHPHVDLKMRVVHHRDQLISMMDAAEIDLAVTGRPPNDRDVCSEAFGCNPLVFVCAPQHPILAQPRLSIKSLEKEPLIVRERESGARAAMEAFLSKQRRLPKAVMEISSNQAIKHAVMAGMGLSFLSLHTVASELRNGQLKALNIAGTPVMVNWNIVHLHSRILSPAAEAFRHFMVGRGAKELRTANLMLLSLAFNKGRQRHTKL